MSDKNESWQGARQGANRFSLAKREDEEGLIQRRASSCAPLHSRSAGSTESKWMFVIWGNGGGAIEAA